MAWSILSRSQTMMVSVCSTFLAIALHTVPIWFFLFGAVYRSPDIIDIDLVSMPMFRDRVFRDTALKSAHRPLEVMPVEPAISVPMSAGPSTKASAPREEDELARTRAIQQAIRALWDSMAPTQPGGALVSLNILPDGTIRDYVINRMRGNRDFQQFLGTFLTTLKRTFVNQGGGSRALWIECEFVVQPTRNSPRAQ